ncbi:MAG: iron ABC transporter permease [Smithellaceae bacterium]|nr:iron ABC transporter permease [Smithellaceae bacterium]
METLRDFFRRPGLVITTAVLASLIALFIVFPIGKVLLKSFSVTYPSVTMTVRDAGSSGGEGLRKIEEILAASISEVKGIAGIRIEKLPGETRLHLRFQRDWDDLKGLNDLKRSLVKHKDLITPLALEIKYKLDRESVGGMETYREFFANSRYHRALKNSLILACISTMLVLPIAFSLAYLGLKGPSFLQAPLRIIGLIPLVAPPFIFSLALIILGGRQGILTKFLGLPFNIYGWKGVILAQVITFLPLGYLMIENVLRSLGSNLEEAAADMRASDTAILFRITIPLAAPGILKAALLVFILSIADFGNPMLIGGDVTFLATGAYMLWVSENNLEMAAVFCVFLILPSLIIFGINEFLLKGKSYATIGGKPQQSECRPIARSIRYPMMILVAASSLAIILCFGIIFFGAFTKILMVDNTFTLEHFRSPNGLRTLITSLKFSLAAALIAPVIGVSLAYILVRKKIPLKRLLESMALLGFAVPGTVMGIGYILAFNSPPLVLTGTFAIMVINEAFRNLSVSIEAGVSKLHQIDIAIEEAAADLGAGSFRRFIMIVLPLISSALIAGFIYTFMVGMIAVSAVIFLITPGNDLAALYILSVAEQGYLGMACAISTVLIGVVLICLGLLKILVKLSKIELF